MMNTYPSLSEIACLIESEEWRTYTPEELLSLRAALTYHNEMWAKEHGFGYAKTVGSTDIQAFIKAVSHFIEALKMDVPQDNYHVLDLGAGPGHRAEALATYPGVQVSVLEPADFFVTEFLEGLRDAEKIQNIYTEGAENMPSCPSNTFDGIYCNAVLHRFMYLEGTGLEIEAVIKEFQRILKKKGIVFVRTMYKADDKICYVTDNQARVFFKLSEEDAVRAFETAGFDILYKNVAHHNGVLGPETPWLDIYAQKK